jgi:hypothetical protein
MNIAQMPQALARALHAWRSPDGGQLGARTCKSRPRPFDANLCAPLADFIDALAPLGMPPVPRAARRSGWSGGVLRARAAVSGAVCWLGSTLAKGLITHRAARGGPSIARSSSELADSTHIGLQEEET